MGGEGFEPSKASLTDLQSAPFGHSGTHPNIKADERTRTVNLLITNQLLCQLSHIGINDSDENRTRVTAVKGRCLNRLTTEPYKKGSLLGSLQNGPSGTRTQDRPVMSRLL